jgi:thiosulfate dehydrogenase (quinone)
VSGAPLSARPPVAMVAIRVVVGWMFFSAFHRRVILEPDKLVPEAAGYVGEKFNQFMPGAILGVGDLIAFLLDRPDFLHVFLWSFTVIEALVGLALIVGAATRLAALGTLLLSAGILFGAGWLGPTCLDEWQIGALGIAGGAALMLGGAGPFSIDAWLARTRPALADARWFRLAADPAPSPPTALGVALAAAAFLVTIGTNQIFHGGVFGTLHNDSVKPRVDVVSVERTDEALLMTLERPVGPETYGAFIVAIRVIDGEGALVRHLDAGSLAALPEGAIENRWLVKVRAGPHGLVVPLGARARVRLTGTERLPAGRYRFELEDVSGAIFTNELELAPPIARFASAQPGVRWRDVDRDANLPFLP